jgi:hypothetical protein
MTVAQFGKLVEQLGIPVVTASAFGWLLFWIIKWVLRTVKTDFGKQIQDLHAELDEELRDARKQIGEIKTILIRLVDRTRLLSEEVNSHDQVARTVWGIDPKVERPRTRADKRLELEEQLREIGKNGKNGDD